MAEEDCRPVLILATSKEAGELYAQELRVPNYLVETNYRRIQGRPIRSMIVSPGYLNAALSAHYELTRSFDVGMQTLSLHSEHYG